MTGPAPFFALSGDEDLQRAITEHVGGLQIAEASLAMMLALVRELPSEALLTPEDVVGLFMDANSLTVAELASGDEPSYEPARAFIAAALQSGRPTPRPGGVAARYGLDGFAA